jgi:WD40 repeat protein
MKLKLTLTAIAALSLAHSAQAQTVVALTGDNTLAMVDAKAGKVTGSVKIDGLSGKVLGIDVRPSDGALYALAADGTVATVDPKTGKATMKSKLESTLPSGVMATVDFNPVADRLRVIGSDGTNLRTNVDDGKVTKDAQLKFAEADANKGATPMIVAGAYTNSVKGPKETALYDIDGKLGVLVKQAPPNDGILNTVGSLGVKADDISFDIATDASGANTGYLMADDTLYTVDVATGKATKVGKISGAKNVRDIAILPGA